MKKTAAPMPTTSAKRTTLGEQGSKKDQTMVVEKTMVEKIMPTAKICCRRRSEMGLKALAVFG